MTDRERLAHLKGQMESRLLMEAEQIEALDGWERALGLVDRARPAMEEATTPSARDRERAARWMGDHLTGSGPDQRGGKVVLTSSYLTAQEDFAAALAQARSEGMEQAAKIADDFGGGPGKTGLGDWSSLQCQISAAIRNAAKEV